MSCFEVDCERANTTKLSRWYSVLAFGLSAMSNMERQMLEGDRNDDDDDDAAMVNPFQGIVDGIEGNTENIGHILLECMFDSHARMFSRILRIIAPLQDQIRENALRLQDNTRALGNRITALGNRITSLFNRITAVEGAQEQLLEQVHAMQATMDLQSHCSAMYREFCDELRNLRAERRNESDADVRAELTEKMRRIEAAAQKMEVSGHIV